MERRFSEHKAIASSDSLFRDYTVYRAIRKYGGSLQVVTLLEASADYCLDIERKLRPKPNTGWNISAGGSAPMLGKSHSEETRARLKEIAACPHRKLRQSERAKSIPTWLHGSSDKIVWASADLVYDCYKAHSKIGSPKLADAFFVGKKKLEAMHYKMREGWNPREDSEWVKWSQGIGEKLESGWRVGDAPIKRKPVDLTDEIRKSRAIGGATRVWTLEMRERLRESRKGVPMSAEAVRKSAEANTGKRRTDAQKAAIKDRLARMPWTNATAIHENWVRAQYIYDELAQGTTPAELLREFDLDRKSVALRKIVLKIKAGWSPSTDEAFQSWLSQYKQKECNESTLAA